MEKNKVYKIYILLFIILGVILSFSAWYYFWVKNWVFETEKSYEKILQATNISSIDSFKYTQDYIKSWFEKKDIEKNKNSKILEEKELKFENKKFDFNNDISIHKFVNSKIPFNNKKYIPNDMEKISSNLVIDIKWWNQVLRKEANEALQKMAKKFFDETNEKIQVVSAYRSYEYQVWIKKWWCPDNLCAKAWFSEHQTGLVVDLWSASSESTWKNNKKLKKYFYWLNQNAHNFWFHNTYQKWIDIDGYDIEPWHWRYLWVELSTYLKENNLTIAEYYNSL